MDDLGFRHGGDQLLDQFRAVGRDLLHTGPVLAEHHATLRRRGRVIEMHDRPLRARDGFEGAADQFLARLGQDLDRHVVGDQVLVDDLADEGEIRIGRGGEADLDLLEAHVAERLEHAELALRSHRLDQRLVAVAKIDGTPGRAFGDGLGRPLPVRQIDLRERLVFLHGHESHGLNSCLSSAASLPIYGVFVNRGAATATGRPLQSRRPPVSRSDRINPETGVIGREPMPKPREAESDSG